MTHANVAETKPDASDISSRGFPKVTTKACDDMCTNREYESRQIAMLDAFSILLLCVHKDMHRSRRKFCPMFVRLNLHTGRIVVCWAVGKADIIKQEHNTR